MRFKNRNENKKKRTTGINIMILIFRGKIIQYRTK